MKTSKRSRTLAILSVCVLTLANVQLTYGAGVGAGGGGNSLNGRLVETYMVDISATPAYQKIADPLLIKLATTFPQSDRPQSLIKYIRDNADDITWYFVPSELKQLTEKVTGLPFPSDQLAVQTEAGEVWIDQNMYDRSDLTEQGRLIVHEMVLRASNQFNHFPETLDSHSVQYGPWLDQDSVMKRVRLTTMFLFDSRTLGLNADAYDKALSALGWGDPRNTSKYPKF